MNDEVIPQHTRLDGSTDYEAALDMVIARATRRLRIFDRALGRSFNAPRRHHLLRSFLLENRANRLHIVLHEVDNVTRDCPRLVTLLRQFSHGITIHQTLPVARGVYDPFAVADDQHLVQRFHYDDARGLLAIDDPHGARPFVERFEEILEASLPAVAPTTLGL